MALLNRRRVVDGKILRIARRFGALGMRMFMGKWCAENR